MYGTIRKNYGAKRVSDVSENVVERSYKEKVKKDKKKYREELQETRYVKVDYDAYSKKLYDKFETPHTGKKFKNEFPVASVILTIVFTMMAMVFAFTHDLQSRIYRGDVAGMENVFERYTKVDAKARFKKHLPIYEGLPNPAKEFRKGMLRQFDKLEVLRESWPELLDWTLENVDNQELDEAWKNSKDDADLEIITEHLMVYFIFTYFCGAVYDEEAHSKMKFSIIGTLMVLETAKTLWAENPDEGRMAAILESAKRYSREVEHSDENIELLEKLSRREGVFGLDSLLTGILN